jgi:DNA repair exonuclease SbcCD ATPase subunit
MEKKDYSVVRNEGYMASEFNIRERHNERKNEEYYNGDIEPERAPLNVHFRQHLRPDGSPETYEETFKRLMAEGVISDKWHKPTSKSFDELVFDVNTNYFERNGGYEYAKKFYEEAYRCAVNEAGGEQYILSAVLHADERNKALSEELGRDVYHYHLHVVYVPVVEKREYFRLKKGQPESERKLKTVYAQISHAKKWPGRTPVERNGKTFKINSYSLLQDRYFEHMKAAGFEGFERGERGSTTEHLDVLDYKIQQDNKRLEQLDAQVEKKEARLDKLDEQITVREKAKATLAEVNAMGHSIPLVPGVHLTDDEVKKLKALARKGTGIDTRAAEQRKKITALEENINTLQGEISDWQQSYRKVALDRDTYKQNYERLWAEVKDFIGAIRGIPNRLRAFIAEHLRQKNDREVSR